MGDYTNRKPKIKLHSNFNTNRHGYTSLLPNTVYEIVNPPPGEKDNWYEGCIWVQGDKRPVKILPNEYHHFYKEVIHFTRTKHKLIRTKFKNK